MPNGSGYPHNNDKNRNYGNNGFKKQMTREQYMAMMMKSHCVICGKYGHQKNEHLEDVSLSPHVKSVVSPSCDNRSNEDKAKSNQNVSSVKP